MDRFCRIFVNSELDYWDFVDLIDAAIGATRHGYFVSNDCMDLWVYRNDTYNPDLIGIGDKRWLSFRYTLEIEPSVGVNFTEYVWSVNTLLQTLWSGNIDAVAACEFEDLLAVNERRKSWTSQPVAKE